MMEKSGIHSLFIPHPIPSLVQDASTDAAFSLLRWLQPVADVMLTAPLGLQFSCQSCGGRWRLE